MNFPTDPEQSMRLSDVNNFPRRKFNVGKNLTALSKDVRIDHGAFSYHYPVIIISSDGL